MAHKTKVTKNFLLYLSNLPCSASESSLLEQVAKFGQVLNIKLVSGTFFTQAWVTFTTSSSAQEALISLNGKKDSKFTIKCRYQSRTPDNYRLYLSNLPLNCTCQDIGELFKDFGPLITYSINKLEDSMQGFVQFESLSQMNLALTNLNSTKISANQIKLEKFEETSHNKDCNGVYLKGFPLWFTKHDLKKLFENFFNISDSAIEEKNGNVCGLVSCQSPEDVTAAILMFDSLSSENYVLRAEGLKVNSKSCQVSRGDGWHDNQRGQIMSSDESAACSEDDWAGFVLYVKNLHPSMNQARLEDLCQEYGAVQVDMDQVENIRYEGGDLGIRKEMLCSGTARVKFGEYESAARAMYALRNKCVEGVRLHVTLTNPNHSSTRQPCPYPYRPKQYNPYQYSRSYHYNRSSNFSNNYNNYSNYNNYQNYNQYKNPAFKGKHFNHRPFPVFKPVLPVQSGHSPESCPSTISLLPCPLPFPLKPQVPGDPQLLESSKSTESDEIEANSSPSGPLSPLNPLNPLSPSKQDLGQTLYPEVVRLTNSDLAGKITGMILELDIPTIQNLTLSPQALSEMVKNAIQVLRSAWAGKADQLSRLAVIS